MVVNEASSNLNALEVLNMEVPVYDLLLIEVMLNRMKLADGHEWEKDGVEFRGLKDLLEFLKTKCQALEAIETRKVVNDIRQRCNAYKAKCMAIKLMYVDSVKSGHACRLYKGNHILAKFKAFQVLRGSLSKGTKCISNVLLPVT
jgi:hypothetical protein